MEKFILIQILGGLRCNNDRTMNNNVMRFVCIVNGYNFWIMIEIAIQIAIQIVIQIIFALCKRGITDNQLHWLFFHFST